MKNFIICAASFSILAALPASAGPLTQARQVVVHYEDINVKQPTGSQILLARIDQASQVVCGPAPNIRQLGAWQIYKSCVQTAVDGAVASLPLETKEALLGQPRETVAER